MTSAGQCERDVNDGLPKLSLLEGGGFEGRDDAEVVRTALESLPEIRVGGLRGIDHDAARQDDLGSTISPSACLPQHTGEGTDLKAHNIVTDKAISGREERDAACMADQHERIFRIPVAATLTSQGQSSNTNFRNPAAPDRNTQGIELEIDVCPAIARTYDDSGQILGRCDLGKGTEVDSDATLYISRAGESGMAGLRTTCQH